MKLASPSTKATLKERRESEAFVHSTPCRKVLMTRPVLGAERGPHCSPFTAITGFSTLIGG